MIIYTPFLLQALAMMFDEFYFHHRRGLPSWERIGHPIDTVSVLVCYIYVLVQPYDSNELWIYITLCGISCLLITKDEFVHTRECEASENWLHALLFVLHPISFLSAGLLWQQNDLDFLKIQTLLISFFLIYQILYWGRYGKRQS